MNKEIIKKYLEDEELLLKMLNRVRKDPDGKDDPGFLRKNGFVLFPENRFAIRAVIPYRDDSGLPMRWCCRLYREEKGELVHAKNHELWDFDIPSTWLRVNNVDPVLCSYMEERMPMEQMKSYLRDILQLYADHCRVATRLCDRSRLVLADGTEIGTFDYGPREAIIRYVKDHPETYPAIKTGTNSSGYEWLYSKSEKLDTGITGACHFGNLWALPVLADGKEISPMVMNCLMLPWADRFPDVGASILEGGGYLLYPNPHGGTGVVFDDYVDMDKEGAGTLDKDDTRYWVNMCPECRKLHLPVLGDARFSDEDDAQGTCSVRGCHNEASYYVDFTIGDNCHVVTMPYLDGRTFRFRNKEFAQSAMRLFAEGGIDFEPFREFVNVAGDDVSRAMGILEYNLKTYELL